MPPSPTLRPALLISQLHHRCYTHTVQMTGSCGSGWPHPIYASERITDRKSTFLAHASHLPSADLVPSFLEHLTSQPQLKRATHCMYAYRTQDAESAPPGISAYPEKRSSNPPLTKMTVVSGQKDGGESGSGDRLARLLEDTRSHNVILVVSRWYGGVKLGNDRWKRINQVAKEALNNGGFIKPKEERDGGLVVVEAGLKAKGKKRRR